MTMKKALLWQASAGYGSQRMLLMGFQKKCKPVETNEKNDTGWLMTGSLFHGL